MQIKNLLKFVLAAMICAVIFAFTEKAPSSKYKCMIQMTNYTGEGAYIAISLLNPKKFN